MGGIVAPVRMLQQHHGPAAACQQLRGFFQRRHGVIYGRRAIQRLPCFHQTGAEAFGGAYGQGLVAIGDSQNRGTDLRHIRVSEPGEQGDVQNARFGGRGAHVGHDLAQGRDFRGGKDRRQYQARPGHGRDRRDIAGQFSQQQAGGPFPGFGHVRMRAVAKAADDIGQGGFFRPDVAMQIHGQGNGIIFAQGLAQADQDGVFGVQVTLGHHGTVQMQQQTVRLVPPQSSARDQFVGQGLYCLFRNRAGRRALGADQPLHGHAVLLTYIKETAKNRVGTSEGLGNFVTPHGAPFKIRQGGCLG